ncbi:MAG: recombinase family protein [Clostridiales bacterium]|jgi:DNA invertase Pin-like site-specific DNA recombinase|nr:recombinase family protein [Clostridiales bacterium]
MKDKDNDKKKRGKQGDDKPDRPLTRAVIYARYSSSGQREESIEGQLRDCYDFARNKGLNVIGEYIDKALSGKTDKRPDFQRMLRDSERGHFEAVIMWKMDRFARNRYDSAMYKYRLKKNGVRICYAKETIPEGPEGIILESVMEGYAEYYSENLSQNVKRGYYDSALELKTLGQKVIGYKKAPDGRFEIDEGQAAVVRRIFEEYTAGERAKDIYTRLNNEGHRTSRGGVFNKNSVRRILQNEKYIGVYEYEDIRVEGGIPAIVDIQLFEKVQTMVEKNHVSPSRGRGVMFLLTTKLFCGHCGSPMTGDGGTSHTGQSYAYYTCNKRRYEHACDKERAPKDWIERLVVAELVRLVHSDEFINEVADKVVAFQEREKDRSALNALQSRQKDNEKAITNMIAAMEAGIITPTTKTRLMELESERANIDKGIARELIAEPTLDREQIIFFLERFKNGDLEDEAYRIMLVDTFLNSVFLYDDDRLVLCMNYSGENSKITLPLVEKAIKGGELSGSSFAPPAASFYLLFQFSLVQAEVWRLNDKAPRKDRPCSVIKGAEGA